MALLLKTMANAYFYAMKEANDKRTEHWFLIDSPIPTIFLLTCYLLFVFEIGPKFMQDRKAYNIDKILMAYNATQVLLCFYTFVAASPYAFAGDITCQEIDYSPESMPIAKLAYVYFWTKIVDLLDTVFFVIRKKHNQVSFLHVYHHSLMVAYVWYGVKYIAGGQIVFIGWLNSLVHMVMYSYYLLTAYNSAYKQSVWWKKHITQLQLAQFAAISIWLLLPVFHEGCQFSKRVVAFLFPQLLAITCLFADFYYKTYIRRKPIQQLDVNGNAEEPATRKSNNVYFCFANNADYIKSE